MNRQQRRAAAHRQKRASHIPYAQRLAQDRAIHTGLEKAARDATVQYEADTATQRAMWLMVCSIADAYGFGPKRMEPFFAALQANTEELERMQAENDEEYAYEKLRVKAEKVTGIRIEYLYEADMKRWREETK